MYAALTGSCCCCPGQTEREHLVLDCYKVAWSDALVMLLQALVDIVMDAVDDIRRKYLVLVYGWQLVSASP